MPACPKYSLQEATDGLQNGRIFLAASMSTTPGNGEAQIDFHACGAILPEFYSTIFIQDT